jgi:uroporphyrinogen decarboxylase
VHRESFDLKNTPMMTALRREPVPHTPIWIMRQAGRYLPEYRQVRAQAGSFLNLCKTPELACEVTLQPIRRYALDASIIFSDILTIPDAMGLGLDFIEGEGPIFRTPLNEIKDIYALPQSDIRESVGYVFDAVALVRKNLPAHIPLIGFSGSPWTLACYMIEGKSSRAFERPIQWLYKEPEAVHGLLALLTQHISQYLIEQINSGANIIMLFDTWGGLLSASQYRHASLHYMQKILEQVRIVHPETPSIVFTKGGGVWLQDIAASGCTAVGLDWTIDIGQARGSVGDRVALQGNLDPAVLLTNPKCIETHVDEILQAYGPHPGHIFNLGHGITPNVPPEHVALLVDLVHEKTRRNVHSDKITKSR